MNRKLINLAIVCAAYDRHWCKDTHFWEMYEDYDGICRDAYYTLQSLGIDHEVSEDDVSECFWSESTEDLLAQLECQE